jgi:hypothetical protein
MATQGCDREADPIAGGPSELLQVHSFQSGISQASAAVKYAVGKGDAALEMDGVV